MQLVTRAEWGAVAPTGEYAPLEHPAGTKVHYTGEHQDDVDHSHCAAQVRAIQAAHMANAKENWLDIAYNWLVCQHGYVFEGRGIHHRSGANGDVPLNEGHYAVCGLVGSSGLTKPTDAMLNGLRDVIDYAHANGAGGEIRGHRDGYATTCPGDALYAWVEAGAPRPGGSTPPDLHKGGTPFPGRQWFHNGADNAYVTQLGRALVAAGFGRHYRVGPGPKWSEADRLNCQEFQASKGWTGTGADGYPGPLTWHELGLD